jgi:hypothetical protein
MDSKTSIVRTTGSRVTVSGRDQSSDSAPSWLTGMHDVVAPAAQRFTVDHKFPIELGFGLHGEPGF